MQQTQADPLVDALVRDFGGNYVFALDLLEQYRRDPQTVDGSWRAYFDRVTGVAPAADPAAKAASAPAQAAAAARAASEWTAGTAAAEPPARPGTLVRQEAAPVLAREK